MKTLDPKPLTRPKELSKCKEKALKEYVPEDPDSDPSLSYSSSGKSDLSDDSKTENLKEIDAIKIKSIGNARNRTRHTHRKVTLICPIKVIIKARD